MIELKKMDDSTLLGMFASGDLSAFNVLYTRYKSKVYTTIYFIVRDKEMANDLTQEVFCKVINKIRQNEYKDDGKFKQWIMRIAHNQAVDTYRKSVRYPTLRESEGCDIFNLLPHNAFAQEDNMVAHEIKLLLKNCIQKLPKDQRKVLIMRHFADMSFKEISEQTGVSINTALGRMRYALLNLKKMLEPHFAYEQNYYP